MSYEIVYDRRFIKVGDKYVPMICQGSSNGYEIVFGGREVAEKNWFVLRYPREKNLLYDTEGIIKIAEYYESLISDDPECIKKSRYKQFEKGEFKRRFIGGMKSAATVEEYAEAGNIIMFVADSYRVQEQIHTTNELSEFLEKYAADVTADVTFRYRDVISPHKRGRGVGIDFSKLPEYYVIACKQSYFRKITSRRVHYNPDPR